jgi:hypothetical protein
LYISVRFLPRPAASTGVRTLTRATRSAQERDSPFEEILSTLQSRARVRPAAVGQECALKRFFDTVCYPVLDYLAARPYGLWVHGNNDTVGAASAVERIAVGLGLIKSADALEVTGAVAAAVRKQGYELGGTLAATLM